MANNYLKKFSTFLDIREMQVKTTFRKQRTLVGETANNTSDNACWRECRERNIAADGNAHSDSHVGKQFGGFS